MILLGLLVICFFIAIVLLTAILRGWTLTILWKWFLIPIFHFPPLTVVQAIGFTFVLGFLIGGKNIDWGKKTSLEDFFSQIGTVILQCLIVLGLGWVITQFM
jgi:hypothetical protein